MPRARRSITTVVTSFTRLWFAALLATSCIDGPVDRGGVSGTQSALTAGTKLNCGGAAAAPFAADASFSGGSTINQPNAIDTSAVVSPAPVVAYQTARVGNFTYTVSGFAPGSSHLVRLHFAETVFSTVGSRRFNVSINGAAVLTSFDIIQAAGASNKAVVREFTSAANTSGAYVITFTNVTNQSLLSALEVVLHPRYLPNDYDGDGRADQALFRPSEGKWYIHRSGGGADIVTTWGNPPDVLVPGDYDGDGLTDFGVFRPTDGKWYVALGAGGTLAPIVFGAATDRMVPGDYDGDGKTDAAYFRPSEGKWHVHPSSGGADIVTSFGTATDRLVPGDYDGDNKTDLAVFRPSEGKWYVHPSRGGADVVTSFGVATDRLVPADYDGDNKTDLAVFRPSEGKWYVHPSGGGADIVTAFGLSTDRVQPADWDGDGKADVAFFRPSDGNWYVHPSGGGANIVTPFGVSTDRQVVFGPAIPPHQPNIATKMDFDGDQRADVAYFRPGDGNWHVSPSAGGAELVTPFGVSTDRPQPADYDGDGRTDVALFRPSEGNWYVHPSAGGADIVTPFGVSTDIQVPGDYDADGKADVAVFRPSEGNWYIHPTTGGADIVTTFGTSTDIPAPADYDGDGKTDIALFRPSEGNWYVHPSAGGPDVVTTWGNATDEHMPGDYDGDGRSDFPLYRPSEGNWYVAFGVGGTTGPNPFGVSSDRPVARDYDGDGRADEAVFRPTEGKFYVHPSAGGSDIVTAFGTSTDEILGGPALGWTTSVCPGPQCIAACGLTKCQNQCNQTSQACSPTLWPGGVVYYQVMDSALSAATASAIAFWNTATGNRISFQASTTRGDRVQIFSGQGNFCAVGYSGGLESCTWSTGISANSAAHELGHAIGLHHEHTRGDRDRYVQVIPNAFTCDQNFSDNWWKCGTGDSGSDFGVYDMTSVMHYQSNPPYYIMERATGVIDELSQSAPPNQKDGSNVLEMYASEYPGGGHGWTKYASLSTDVGSLVPLQVTIPSPPATGSNVTVVGRPAVASQGGAGNLDAYVTGSDGHIYHRYRASGTWAGYDDLGGTTPWGTDPAAASWGTGSAIVVAGRAGTLYWKQFANGAWGSWLALPALSVGMAAGSSPAAVAWAPGVLHVFYRNVNNALSVIEYSGGAWGSWGTVPPAAPAGITFSGNPSVASQQANALDVFINSTNGHLWHTFWTASGWSNSWEDNACCTAAGSSPAASSWGPGRVDVVFKGSDGLTWWRYYNGTWNGPLALGGILGSSPVSVSGATQRIDVLSVGADGGLWNRWYN